MVKKKIDFRFVFWSLEIVLILSWILLFFPIRGVLAEVNGNATVRTYLQIENSAPIIQNIDVEGGSIVLIANSSKQVNCSVEIIDYDGDADISHVEAYLFDNSASSKYASDDNNSHYTNSSCYIDTGYGDANTALANCYFDVWYYANPGTWNCSVNVEDFANYYDNRSNISSVETLLSVGLPESIDYGSVNATYISLENITNVTNFGNVKINLSLYGYGAVKGDGYAMNCSLGSVQNISIEHEKYNLTDSNPSVTTLGGTSGTYLNLSTNSVVRTFNLAKKTSNDEVLSRNQTYWRIYVPLGVAGDCQGHIVFGATTSPGV